LSEPKEAKGGYKDAPPCACDCKRMVFHFLSFEESVAEGSVDYKLAQYVACTAEESRKHKFASLPTDKCSPSMMSLMNGVISFPNNVAALCAPQVEKCRQMQGLDGQPFLG
jgi:hypothetical protein